MTPCSLHLRSIFQNQNLAYAILIFITVIAEIITELILERAGPVIFETFLLESKALRLISSNLSCKKSKASKLLVTIINSRQALSRNKISNFSEINSWKNFSGCTGPAIRNANRGDSHESPQTRDSQFLAPPNAIRNKGVQLEFGNLETIRENQAIRANQGAAKGGRQKEFDHFLCFRDSFGHFLVTFSDASVTFFVTFLPGSWPLAVAFPIAAIERFFSSGEIGDSRSTDNKNCINNRSSTSTIRDENTTYLILN